MGYDKYGALGNNILVVYIIGAYNEWQWKRYKLLQIDDNDTKIIDKGQA